MQREGLGRLPGRRSGQSGRPKLWERPGLTVWLGHEQDGAEGEESQSATSVTARHAPMAQRRFLHGICPRVWCDRDGPWLQPFDRGGVHEVRPE